MSRVMGLDLSLTATGLALVVDGEVVEATRIRTTGKKNDDLAARRARLNGGIFQPVMEEAAAFVPDLVVIESPSYGSKFGSPHDRSGLWWMVVDCLFDLGAPVGTVSPQGRAKYGTGKGNADKATVYAAAQKTYFDVELADDNVADAVLLAAMGSRYLGKPVERTLSGRLSKLSDKQLEALDGAAWPAPLEVAA